MSGAFDLRPDERKAAVDALERMRPDDFRALQWAVRVTYGDGSPLLEMFDAARLRRDARVSRLERFEPSPSTARN